MKRHLDYPLSPQATLAAFIAIIGIAAAATAASGATEWAFKPSYFSHDPVDGRRVAQYSPVEKAYAEIDNFRRSGYRQQRIRIQGASGSADNIHMVETWGEGEWIRPYGEWLRPFRDGATPYGPWGNPQGPWTMPFESWVNPYGLGQLPQSPWPYWSNYATPYPAQGPMQYGGQMYGGQMYGGGQGYGSQGHGGQGHGGQGPGGPMPAQWQQP